jgi:hypothetical protein
VVSQDQVKRNRRAARMVGYGKLPDDVGEPPAGPPRPADVVLDRALALNVVVAVARGLDGAAASRWADGLGVRLLDDEQEYVEDAADDLRVEDAARATAVEALAVLLWALGLSPEPPPIDDVADGARSVLPGPGEPLAVDAALRPVDELRAFWDLLAGMAWALRADDELEVGQSPGTVDPYVVRQRLRAAAWVLGADWSVSSSAPGPGPS